MGISGIIISPAKRLNTKKVEKTSAVNLPLFGKESVKIMERLKRWNGESTREKLHLSEKYGAIAFERNQNWHATITGNWSHPAIHLYQGDVFRGMRTDTISSALMQRAQRSLRILSAVYGLLRPLDGIYPYRLQMSTELPVDRHANLYQFWNQSITEAIHAWVSKNEIHLLVNLASLEYFSVIDTAKLHIPIIQPVFRQIHHGRLSSLSLYIKKARGMMTRFILENEINCVEGLKTFDRDGYLFDEDNSTNDRLVFFKEV